MGELVRLNLTSPVVLAFALGVLAALVRSDLRMPAPVQALLSTYLLFAIGLKGGRELAHTAVGDLAGPLVATLVLGCLTPVVTYVLVRRLGRFSVADAAALAAHYGSVSAVTFTAALSFATTADLAPEGFMPSLVAFLEIPGIVIALVIAQRVLGDMPLRQSLHEVLTGKSVVLLVGGLVIGVVTTDAAYASVEPFFVDLFKGVLCLFLLDLGVTAGNRLGGLRRSGPFLPAFAVGAPVVFGTVGVLAGTLSGLSVGGAAVLGAMVASASYIAAPAAVQVALPDADPGTYLLAALGITFPFNLAVGIPLYTEIAKLVA